MYVIHPKKLIYLANPKTGSTSFGMYWLREKYNYGQQERTTSKQGLQVVTDDFPTWRWGNHHGIDKKYFDDLKNRNYTSFTVVRNPWDHVVSWYHGSGRANIEFEEFVKNFDDIVQYTLPDSQPGNLQVLTAWADRFAHFENLEPELSEIMGETVELDQYNVCRNRKPYREYYNDELKAIVAKRCCDFLLDFPYSF